MGEVVPFTEELAGDVAALFLRGMRGQNRPAPPALRQYFCDILLRNPWASSDMPSWVYLEAGKVVGNLGVIPREMKFGERTVRMAVATQFIVDPDQRRGPAAMVLLRKLFSGPQDLTWTDGASDVIHQLWTAFGGHAARYYSFQWMRFLRPFAFGQDILSRRNNQGLNLLTGLVAKPADAILTRLAGGVLRPAVPAVLAKEVSTEELFACIQASQGKAPLTPLYQEASFAWLMAEIAKSSSNGALRRIVVPAKDGYAGWAVYLAKPGGSAYILQIGARRRDLFNATLGAVFYDAWQQGCSVIRGYGMAAYQTQLTEHACIFRHPGSSAIVQSKNPDILNTVLTGDAVLTRLDGECWLRFSSEKWT